MDPTGAGDAFNAGLAVGLSRGLELAEAIQLGCHAGAYCVTQLGVLDGLATTRAIRRNGSLPSRISPMKVTS